MTGLLRSELRKIFSTKLWWGLLLPVLALSILVNLFGGVVTDAVGQLAESGAALPVLLVSLAYSLGLTSVFAVVLGIASTAGEFRHRTVTSTYLTAPGRGAVLLAKMATAAAVGALYAVAAVLGGLLAGAAAAGDAFPQAGPVVALTAIGMAVCALWGAFGAALGTVIGNQVGALGAALGYLLVGELLISGLLGSADAPAVERLGSYLPGNAGDIALYEVPAPLIVGPQLADRLVEALAGVSAPPPWWGALLVLAAWTAAAGATGWVVGGRRDVT